MRERYYLAYGSNLSLDQMSYRCPDAIPVGKAWIDGYELLFKGSKTGSYLTIEKKAGSRVPVVVWKISASDERNLDRYEGCPTFYYKKMMKVRVESFMSGRKGKEIEALVYIMHENRKLGVPTGRYYSVCYEGYKRFGMDEKYLRSALARTVGAQTADGMVKKWRWSVQGYGTAMGW